MKYVNRVLQPGESVVYATSLHWLIFVKSTSLLVLALACLIASGWFIDEGIAVALKIIAALLFALSLVYGTGAFVERATTELAVTDRRVIFKTGLFRRHTMEMNRSKVETIGVDQTVFGRLLNYGTVIVRGTGGSFEPIRHIDDPLTFRNHITAG